MATEKKYNVWFPRDSRWTNHNGQSTVNPPPMDWDEAENIRALCGRDFEVREVGPQGGAGNLQKTRPRDLVASNHAVTEPVKHIVPLNEKVTGPSVDSDKKKELSFFSSTAPGECICGGPKAACWIHKDA